MKNYVHRDKQQIHQEIEDGYVYVKHSDAVALPSVEILP